MVPSDPALAQLVDMGIPTSRARAALRRSKGDVMSAAERVFAGEFDDIASDDEETPDIGLPTPDESSNEGTLPISKRALEGMRIGDNATKHDDADNDIDNDDDGDKDEAEDDDGSSGSFDGDMYEDEYDMDEDLEGPRLTSDPYAGIFFSKDRVDEIVEPVEQAVHVRVNLVDPNGGRSKASELVRILNRGEWMSGCPEGNEQSFLFQLYSLLTEGSMPCHKGCGHVFPRLPEHFFALYSSFQAYTAALCAIIAQVCPVCQHVTCLACGDNAEPSSSARPFFHSSEKGKETSNGDDPLLHCVNIQGVMIGVGLHMIEQAFFAYRAGGSTPPLVQAPPAKKRKTEKLSWNDSDDDDDDLLGRRSASKGVGYSGSGQEDRSGQIAAQKAQEASDHKTVELLSQVQEYLPRINRPGGPAISDHLVHPTALAHLRRRSGFVNELLRNDSLLDMSSRGDLYRALLDWLEIVSSHEALASMLAMPQMRPSRTCPGPDTLTVTITYEGGPSPRELLESVVIQARAALKGLQATQVEKKESDEDSQRMTMEEKMQKEKEELEAMGRSESEVLKRFCDRIIAAASNIDRSLVECKGAAFVERMQGSLPHHPDAEVQVAENVTATTDEAVSKIYEEWANRARFQYCEMSEVKDDKVVFKHAYDSQIRSIENMSAPKRSLAIAKELAILTTSLPAAWHSTIFLRVDEARVDCLKALIIGPEGTPYENGCFIFDIFLPLDYNFKCPLVKFMTTNGGKYRYNPNLYADGKVCLSLLGTWQGPGWVAGQSTLLQVLISLQSLILCEEPYLNEPGWANDSGTPQSKSYSANVRRMVVVDAMANNLKNPPYPFESVIKTHFRLKADSIEKQLDKWIELDDGSSIHGEYYGGMTLSAGLNSSLDPTGTASPTGTKGPKTRAAGKQKPPQTPMQRAADDLKALLADLRRGQGGEEETGGGSGAGAGAGSGAGEGVKDKGKVEKKKKGKK